MSATRDSNELHRRSTKGHLRKQPAISSHSDETLPPISGTPLSVILSAMHPSTNSVAPAIDISKLPLGFSAGSGSVRRITTTNRLVRQNICSGSCQGKTGIKNHGRVIAELDMVSIRERGQAREPYFCRCHGRESMSSLFGFVTMWLRNVLADSAKLGR